MRNLLRGSLAAVIPLAAAATVHAQCNGETAPRNLTTGNTVTSILVGGYTFLVTLVTLGTNARVVVRPAMLGSLYFGYVAMRGLGLANSSSYFTELAFNFSDDTGILCRSVSDPNCAIGAHVLIPILGPSSGEVGWVELEVTSISASEFSFIVKHTVLSSDPADEVHIGLCAGALPVELVSFDAISDDSSVHLRWRTASELNNAGFEVQRSRRDGTFDKVAFIPGQGTTTDAQSYVYEDDTVEPNAHYRYRLKQIDFDGATSFSEIVEVFTEDPSQIALSEFYPNPASNGRASLKINLADAAEATVEVFDIRGALVDSKSSMLSAGENRLAFRTDGLAAGMHFAKVQIGKRVMYRQFVVAR